MEYRIEDINTRKTMYPDSKLKVARKALEDVVNTPSPAKVGKTRTRAFKQSGSRGHHHKAK